MDLLVRGAAANCRLPSRKRSLAGLALLTAGLVISIAIPVHAQMSGLQRIQYDSQPSANAAVRLYYVNSTWPEILHKLAEGTGSHLVMDSAPSGRASRLDRKQYTRPEAVRILNRELEPMGYRLIEKGDNLVLLNLREIRNEYRRPQIAPPPDERRAADSAAPLAGPAPQRSVSRIVPAAASTDDPGEGVVTANAVAVARPSIGTNGSKFVDHRPKTPNARATVTPAANHILQDSEPEEGADSLGSAAPHTRVALRQRKAVDVARLIFESQKPHSALLDDGPDGLPAFEVKRRLATESSGRTRAASSVAQVDYTIGIDAAENELVVAAPEGRARQIERLIHLLDARPARRGDVEHLVPMQGETKRLAENLQTALNQLTDSDAIDSEEPPAEKPPAPRPSPRPAEDSEEPPAAAPKSPRAESPPVQINLQGPVTVREVPGVGLVVTGNKADVDAVLGVIRVLELAGSGVTPDIHLLGLKHVDSEALAELLNQVYEGLGEIRNPQSTAQQKNVRFFAVVKPNAVMIVAPAKEMESVLELAEALDQPVDPEAEIEVFRLKHAVASQVATSVTTFYDQRKPLGTRIKVMPDARTNSVVVYARPNDLKEIARLIRKVDQGTSSAVSRMRIFPLKNATAPELAALINTAVQSVVRPPATTGLLGQQGGGAQAATTGGQSSQQLTEVKSTILEFLASDGDQQKLIRSGILTDIRVTADAGRNTLIVSAPEASMPLLEVLIQQLDQPTPLVAEIKVFTLANSDASATVELLRSLFTGQTQQQGGGFNQLQNQLQQGGLQLAGAEGAGAGLIPLRFSVDPRTNTIIAIGTGEALQIVEAILLRLDESDIRQRRNAVIKLKHSFANDVAVAVNQFLTAQRDLAQLDPNLVTNVELLEREIIVVPELVSNSLLISATPRYFQEVINLIMQLDQKPQEVVIQALLVEVDLTNNDEYGVELGLQDSVLFRRSIANVPGFLFNNQQLGNNTGVAGSGDVGGQGLSNFSLNRTNNDLGFGGLVLSASSESVSVLIRALSAKRTVHTLSRPQIRTLDNQLAQILVGQQVPVATGVATTGLTAASPQVQLRDVGIVLTVVPRISPEGSILMEVAATRSSVSANRVPIFTDINTGNTVDSPIINVTTAQATISVPNGQTVVLGGMITKSDDAFERKVPWLGDLPYIGNVFRYEGVNSRRTELLIFLTPRVVRHESDSEIIKRVEAERMHFIERDAEEVHGPLYAAPPPDVYLNRYGPDDCPPVLRPGTFDDARVPTTIMPSSPDASVVPIPGAEMQRQQVSPQRVVPRPPAPNVTSPPTQPGAVPPAAPNSPQGSLPPIPPSSSKAPLLRRTQ